MQFLRSCGKTSSSSDSGRCQHVEACSEECHAAPAVKWTEAAKNTCYKYEALVV
jgi:hypothetical protein